MPLNDTSFLTIGLPTDSGGIIYKVDSSTPVDNVSTFDLGALGIWRRQFDGTYRAAWAVTGPTGDQTVRLQGVFNSSLVSSVLIDTEITINGALTIPTNKMVRIEGKGKLIGTGSVSGGIFYDLLPSYYSGVTINPQGVLLTTFTASTFGLVPSSGGGTNNFLRADGIWAVPASGEPAIMAGTTSQYWRGDKTFQTLNTTAVTEGTNLYYTDLRARLSISLTTTGSSGAATYNSSTGVLNIPQYVGGIVSLGISGSGQTGATQVLETGTNGTDFNIVSASNTHTFNIPNASGSNRGALTSSDWTTFSNKQNTLVSGTNIKTINGVTILGSGDIITPRELSSLTAATTSNTIDNGNNTQTWQWNSLVNTGIELSSTSTTSTNDNSVLKITRSGANVSPNITTKSISSTCVNTGSNSTNYGGSFYAGGGTTNISLYGVSDSSNSTGVSGVAYATFSAPTNMVAVKAQVYQFGSLNMSATALLAENYQVAGTPYGIKVYMYSGGTSLLTSYGLYFEGGTGGPSSILYGNYIRMTNEIAANTHALVTVGGNVGFGTARPNSKAIVEMVAGSFGQVGFLPPRITTAIRDAVTSVPTGLFIYDTTVNKFSFYNGSAWVYIDSGGSGGSSYTVTNEGNDRIITSVSAGNGNAESNFTFNGTVGAISYTGTNNDSLFTITKSAALSSNQEINYFVARELNNGGWLSMAYKEGEVSGSPKMMHIYSDGGFYFKVYDGTINRYHRFDSNGRFGINNINAPAFTLDVNGTGRFVNHLTLSAIPDQDDALTQVLVRDTTTGQIKYRSASTFGGGGTLTDGDKGDITVSASGATWTIDNNVVSLAKFQQIDTASFLGRVTSSTGNVEVLTGTQATTLLDTFTSTVKGVVPASGGGTSNFLRADGVWAAPSGGGGGLSGSGTADYVAKWTGASALGLSVIYDNGNEVAIGTATVNPQTRLTVMGSASYPKSIALDSTWSFQTSWSMKNGIYSAEFNLGGSTKSTAEGGPGSLQISTYNSSTNTYRYPVTFYANANAAFSGSGSTVPTDNGSTLQVYGTVHSSSLSGTGTRMVVADFNGVLSTEALPQKVITSGTAAPNGGADGDIYLQYV